jgi:hypothetical protein
MNVDIIYSLLVHESPESALDCIKNILYYNKNYKIAIIINCNSMMHPYIINYSEAYHNVFVTSNPWDKNAWGYDIMKAHIQNFEHCYNNQITSTHFITLASNCMFHKQLDISQYNNKTMVDMTDTTKETGWHWEKIYNMYALCEFVKKYNIHTFKVRSIEGRLYEYDKMQSVLEFINDNNIQEYTNVITPKAPCEEFLLPSIYALFTGYLNDSICKVFWDLPNYTPSFEQIIECEYPCVKRVDREYNNDIRVKLREMTNNYSE